MRTLIVVLAACLLTLAPMRAQNFKFGHVNGAELVTLMPERDSAQAQLKRLTKQYADQIELLQVELNNKYNDYMNNQATYTDVIKATKEKEIQDLNQRVQEFQVNAQKDLQKREQELIQPIYKKVEVAIKKVGKSNAFTYIFDVSGGGFVYVSEQSIDVSPLVKKELGIK